MKKVIFLFTSQRDPYGYAQTSDAHGLHTTASIYLKNGEISIAAAYFADALAADSNQTETLNDYGLLLASQQKYDEARKCLPMRGNPFNSILKQVVSSHARSVFVCVGIEA